MTYQEKEDQIKRIKKNQIKEGQTFRFGCDKCGKCCHNMKDVILTSFDIYRMAKALDITMEEWIDLYANICIGQESKLPVVSMKSIGETRRCPFVKDNECVLYENKPDVCSLFPLGRCVVYPKDEAVSDVQIMYFHNGVHCGTDEKEWTLSEWKETYALDEREKFFIRWTLVHQEISDFATEIMENCKSEKLQIMVINMFMTFLYTHYSTEEAFLPQFEQNMENLKTEIARVQELIGGKE